MKNPSETTAMSLSALELLPTELIVSVAENLCTTDFKELRLSSRTLASITRPLLSRTCFNGLPWRNDAQRLYELSQVPECAQRIRTVTFNFGQLNEYKVLHESFSHHALLDPAFNTERLRDKWANYYRTQALSRRAGKFRPDLLEHALAGLPALGSLCLTWTRCPWDDTEPRRVFRPSVSVRMAKGAVADVQQAVLDALWKSGTRLHTLGLEPLPVGELELPLGEPDPAVDFFAALTTLNLAVKRKAELVLQDELEMLLAKTPAVSRLRLEFLPPKNEAPEEPDFLLNTHLPRLEAFELVLGEMALGSLASFLVRHAATMKSLWLVDCKALHGSDDDEDKQAGLSPNMASWDDLFKCIRRDLAGLNKVYIDGTFQEVTGKALVFFHKEICIGPAPISDVRVAPAETVEKYILEGGDYLDLWY